MLAFLLAGFGMMAQKNDPEAKKILDAVSAKFKTFSTVQAGFTYKVENAEGKAHVKQDRDYFHERNKI